MQLASIILSAGRSRRMGEDKALLSINGISALQTIINAITPFAEQIIVVAGKNYPQLKDDYPAIYNENWQKGMFSSLQKGLSAVSEDKWIMLHLIDHPFILPATYQKLVNAINDDYLVIKPFLTTENRSGHPILISPELRNILLKSPQDTNLKEVMHSLPLNKIKFLPVNDKGIIDNLNTQPQFQQRIKKKTEPTISV
jgi:molybdenum cofactor cytidylyltransferase